MPLSFSPPPPLFPCQAYRRWDLSWLVWRGSYWISLTFSGSRGLTAREEKVTTPQVCTYTVDWHDWHVCTKS